MKRKVKKHKSRRDAKRAALRRARKDVLDRMREVKARWAQMLKAIPDKEANAATVEYIEERIEEIRVACYPDLIWAPGEFTRAFIAFQDCQNAFVDKAITARQKLDTGF